MHDAAMLLVYECFAANHMGWIKFSLYLVSEAQASTPDSTIDTFPPTIT